MSKALTCGCCECGGSGVRAWYMVGKWVMPLVWGLSRQTPEH